MNHQKPQITVIIVNYKVKEYVANLLDSIRKAIHDIPIQTIVVDNNSNDGSVNYLRELNPDVTYIANKENVGFGKANNQAIAKAKGEYTLLINPDSIVSEDCLQVMKAYMDDNPDCAASGCKILNADGTLAPESRRSIPTISSSIYKLIGLAYLFPNNRQFGKYYLSWLPENEVSKIPVLSGSFMFFRTEVLKEVGGFDERFFMYAEDIDLCYRIGQKGYEIHYVPYTSVVHYKGESSKKDNLKYIKNFNDSLYLFFEKHYTNRYSQLFRIVILVGIFLKKVIGYTFNAFESIKHLILDVLILNIALVLSYVIRFYFDVSSFFEYENIGFLWINAILTVLYLFFIKLIGKKDSKNYLLSEKLKSLILTYIGIVVITFFVRELAFSRLIFAMGFLFGISLLALTHVIRQHKSENLERTEGKILWKKIAIVGEGERTSTLIDKLRSKVDWEYKLVGLISVNSSTINYENREGIHVIGHIDNIKEIVDEYNIDQLYFSLSYVSYEELLKTLSIIKDKNVTVKIIPYRLDFLLGKSQVEYLDNVPLIDFDISYNRLSNRIMKRAFDLFLSIIVGIMLSVPALLQKLKHGNKQISITRKNHKGKAFSIDLYHPLSEKKYLNMLKLVWHVIKGNMSWVGAPLDDSSQTSGFNQYYGLTGLIQLNYSRIKTDEDKERFDLHYLQNHSLGIDIDILVKSMVYGPGPLEYLNQQSNLEPPA